MNVDLNGRVALITGAAQGLGLAIAERLRESGARLALVDIQAESLGNAAEQLGGKSSELAGFTADLRDPSRIRALPDQVVEHFGGLDILVNNAGVRSIAPILEHPLDQWQQTIDVNLTAPFLMVQAAVPHMLRRGKGKIVNVTSVAADLGFKNRCAYNVSKAGLAMLTKSVALELAPQGIQCNAVAPGIIETPLNQNYFRDETFARVIVDNTPAAAWGVPGDIAAAVAFLCSDHADFINGATIHVDGGWSTGKGY